MNERERIYRFDRSMELFNRAARIIPGGIYGHFSPTITVPGSFPYYTARAGGCRYTDVDGNEMIDYMCGFGPMVLGYRNAAVDSAAAAQQALADCTTHPGEVMIELAERLVGLITIADWAFFGKNGGDMTTYALLVARAYTNRKKIIMVRGHYHGVAPWCTALGFGGIIPEDHQHILMVHWNDLDEFARTVREHRGEIAGFIAQPYHHINFGDQVMPAPGYWEGIERICREEGIVLILDDVRTGFRLSMKGSGEHFGFEPDLCCYCKAIANGYPLSACVGRKELINAASKVFFTGSYWTAQVPMAASLATLDELERTGAVEKMRQTGTLLLDGLRELGNRHGLEVTVSGPPAIPFMRFTEDRDFYWQQIFCSEVTRRGSFFHPHHNWFISAAHERADIEETLNHAEAALKVLKRQI